MIGRANPYPGPRPFRTGETLYGRARESRELTDLLIAERIVLLYAPSGAGKTSLIRAALIPRMQAEGYQILPIARPGAATDGVAPRPAGNPFVARVIAAWEEGRPEGAPALTDIAGITLAAFLSQRAWIQADPRLTLLILDQFEEILTCDAEAEAKIAFFQQLGDALRDQHIWALIAMREEYSAALDSYRHLLPTRLATRLRLELLGRDEALEAIRNPARDAGVDYAGDADQRLLDELGTVRERTSDGVLVERRVPFVEPLHLQIVCHRLWGRLPEGARAISTDDLGLGEGRGGRREVQEALEEYYASVMAEVAARTGEKERRIRDWLEQELVTPQGLRRQVLRGEKETAGLANRVVDALAGGSLLRSDARGGARWYEVTHDRLAAVILQGNARWFERHLAPFQIRAGIWSRMRHAGAYQSAAGEVLTGAELRRAEQWARRHPDEGTRVDQEYLAYCRAEWDRGRRDRWLRMAVAGLAAVALIGGLSLWIYMKERFYEELSRQRASERTRALLSASATEKWRGYNHELATLLAVQAYRFAATSDQKEALQARAGEMLRDALQAQPFAYGVTLANGARGSRQGADILLSRQPGLLAVREGDCRFRLHTLWGPGGDVREITAGAEVKGAEFSPEDRFLAILTVSGMELHPVAPPPAAESAPDSLRIATQERPLGPFCLSQDGQRAAIAVDPGDIEVWGLEPGAPALVAKVPGAVAQIPAQGVLTALACDPTGTRVAWGTGAGSVGLVDLGGPGPSASWALPNRFDGWPVALQKELEHRKDSIDFGVIGLHYLPEREWLVALYRNGPPRVFDLGGTGPEPTAAYLLPNRRSEAALEFAIDRGAATRRIVSLERYLTSDADPDGKEIAVGGARALVGRWHLDTWSVSADKLDPASERRRIPKGHKEIYAAYDEIPGFSAGIEAIRYARPAPPTEPPERWLSAADAALDIRSWSLSGLQGAGYPSFQTWKQKPGVIYALAFVAPPADDPKALRLAFGGTLDSGVLRIDPDILHMELDPAIALPTRIRALATDADRRRLLIATGNEGQYSWLLDLPDKGEASAERLPEAQDPHTDGQWAAVTNAEGTLLLTVGWDGKAVIWRAAADGRWASETLVTPDHPGGPKSALLAAALAPDGRDLVLGSFGGQVRLWRADGGNFEEQSPLLDGGAGIRALAYSPDGALLVAGDENGLLWIWDRDEGDYCRRPPLLAHQGSIYSVSFGSDGRLVTGGSDGRVYLWHRDPPGLDQNSRHQPTEPQKVRTVGPTDSSLPHVRCANRAPPAGTVIDADPFRLDRRLRLGGPRSEVVSAALAPSGGIVAACDADGYIHLWELNLAKLIERACGAMKRNLSAHEWSRYVGSEGYACTCPRLPPGPGVNPAQVGPDAGCAVVKEPRGGPDAESTAAQQARRERASRG